MNSPSGQRVLRAGVIAAGWGERLRHGEHQLKPLVPVAGLTLVERVLTSLAEANPAEVVVIVNEASKAVRDHVTARRWPFPLTWIVETTPSSMHSFLRVVETLAASGDTGPFLLSTVDTIAPPGAYAAFADASCRLSADVVLAVTEPGDDEKPLLVKVGSEGCLTPLRPHSLGNALSVEAIGVQAAGAPYATAGYYSVRSSILREADAARSENLTALRTFLERLLVGGYRIAAVPVAASVDVDRPDDIRAAETFLKQVGA